jgi:hypothetical protein
MAYQARVAIDRIKFAIKHTEQFAPRTDTIREAGPATARCARTLGIGMAPLPTTVAVLPEPLALGGDTKWEWHTDRGVAVTARDRTKRSPLQWSACHQIVETMTRCCC